MLGDGVGELGVFLLVSLLSESRLLRGAKVKSLREEERDGYGAYG